MTDAAAAAAAAPREPCYGKLKPRRMLLLLLLPLLLLLLTWTGVAHGTSGNAEQLKGYRENRRRLA